MDAALLSKLRLLLTEEELSEILSPHMTSGSSAAASTSYSHAPTSPAKGRSKAKKDTKRFERYKKRQAWKTDLRTAERMLGLRQVHVEPPEPQQGASWAEHQSYAAAVAQSKVLLPVDVLQPPPFDFEDQPVFISIDMECYERDKSKVTEIGLATLDTLDLIGHPPGVNAINWISKARALHFRVAENQHLVNSEFCEGAPDRFEFGQSEIVSLKDCPKRIATCFRPPYSAEGVRLKGPEQQADPARRTIVLVGHDPVQDIQYLCNIGYDVSNLRNLHSSIVDTAGLFMALAHEPQPRSLGGLLKEFDIPAFHLHNAGNDAYYTLQVMLSIVLRSSTTGRENKAKKQIEEAARAREAEAAASALARAQEDAHGWSSDEDDELSEKE